MCDLASSGRCCRPAALAVISSPQAGSGGNAELHKIICGRAEHVPVQRRQVSAAIIDVCVGAGCECCSCAVPTRTCHIDIASTSDVGDLRIGCSEICSGCSGIEITLYARVGADQGNGIDDQPGGSIGAVITVGHIQAEVGYHVSGGDGLRDFGFKGKAVFKEDLRHIRFIDYLFHSHACRKASSVAGKGHIVT